jgi:uncharacterized protein (DUF305 family)
MAAVADEELGALAPAPASRSPLRAVLLAVIGVGLLLIGGAGAVALGIGRDEPPSADSVDAGFARDMSVHHLQGVEMANLALDKATDPQVRSIAFDISATQTNQVGRMQGWLTLWGVPISGGERMAWMAGSGHDHMAMGADGLMPGMATEGELTDLQSRTGTDFDMRFLQLMIRHHQGGRAMAEYAAQHAELAPVRSLARSIDETQTAETTTMSALLTSLGGTPLPPPS